MYIHIYKIHIDDMRSLPYMHMWTAFSAKLLCAHHTFPYIKTYMCIVSTYIFMYIYGFRYAHMYKI